MNPREFFINPADYGLPTRDELVAYRIWDNHFHGFASANPIEQYERNNFFVERMGIERSIAQEVGGTLEEPFAPYPYDAEILKILERDKDRLPAARRSTRVFRTKVAPRSKNGSATVLASE